jgi:hypothetical protein
MGEVLQKVELQPDGLLWCECARRAILRAPRLQQCDADLLCDPDAVATLNPLEVRPNRKWVWPAWV